MSVGVDGRVVGAFDLWISWGVLDYFAASIAAATTIALKLCWFGIDGRCGGEGKEFPVWTLGMGLGGDPYDNCGRMVRKNRWEQGKLWVV